MVRKAHRDRFLLEFLILGLHANAIPTVVGYVYWSRPLALNCEVPNWNRHPYLKKHGLVLTIDDGPSWIHIPHRSLSRPLKRL